MKITKQQFQKVFTKKVQDKLFKKLQQSKRYKEEIQPKIDNGEVSEEQVKEQYIQACKNLGILK